MIVYVSDSPTPSRRWRVETGEPLEAPWYRPWEKKQKSLSQKRWKVRTDTQGCPLAAIHVPWHVYAHTHTYQARTPCTHKDKNYFLEFGLLFFFTLWAFQPTLHFLPSTLGVFFYPEQTSLCVPFCAQLCFLVPF